MKTLIVCGLEAFGTLAFGDFSCLGFRDTLAISYWLLAIGDFFCLEFRV